MGRVGRSLGIGLAPLDLVYLTRPAGFFSVSSAPNGFNQTDSVINCSPLKVVRGCSVSWLWGPGFTGRTSSTTSVSVGELRLAAQAGPSSWS